MKDWTVTALRQEFATAPWPDLFWSLALRQAWENRFPELAEIGESQFWSD